jgi:hypothetical protein
VALEQSKLAIEKQIVAEVSIAKPKKCSRHMDCNCDNTNRPFNQVLHNLTDDAIDYAFDAVEKKPHSTNISSVKSISDRKRIDYLKDYIEKEHLAITDIIRKFISEGCIGFAWSFLIELPAFKAEIPKYYKCRYPICTPKECMVCNSFLENRGFITRIQHQDLILVEHYPSVMMQLIADVIEKQDITNLEMFHSYCIEMNNFKHYYQVFRQYLEKSSFCKNKIIKRWLKRH